MTKEIQTFVDVQPPEFAVDLHQQILDYSEKAEQGIDVYLNDMEDGILGPCPIGKHRSIPNARRNYYNRG